MALDNGTVLEQVLLRGSNNFQQTVTPPNQGNIQKTMDDIYNVPSNFNEFQEILPNLIGNTKLTDRSFANPLNDLKMPNFLPYGGSIEEIALDLVESKGYDLRNSNIFEVNPGRVYNAFHKLNVKRFWEISISESELRQAFLSGASLDDFVSRKIDKLATSAAKEDMDSMIELIAKAHATWGLYVKNVPAANLKKPTAEESKDLSFELRALAGDMEFITGLYNSRGVPTVSGPEDLFIITTPREKAALEVNVLADAFHMEKTDFDRRVITIPEFPIAGVRAALVDRGFFMCADYKREYTSFFNPKNLVTNVYLHLWSIYSVSPFANAVLLGNLDETQNGLVTIDVEDITASVIDELGDTTTGFTYGDKLQLVVTAGGTVTPSNGATEVEADSFVVPSAYTADIELVGVKTTSRTYVDRLGQIFIQDDVPAGTQIKITVRSAYVDPSGDGTRSDITATTTLTVA